MLVTHLDSTVRRLTARSPRRGVVGLLATALLISTAPGTAQAADTQAPTVSVTSPVAGSTVTGTTALTASASDDAGVTEVKWFVDGVEVGWDGAAPWEDAWSFAELTAGSHRVHARASDAAGNWGTSPDVFVTRAAASTSPTTTTTTSWQLVQSDNFSGTAVDTTKWRTYGPWIPGHAGNGIRDGRAVSVANGLLTITARMIDGTLVSGGMSNRLNQAYGKFEFRARTDADPSLATSGVILTWPQSGRWPIDGENDIYETTLDADRTPLKTFIHYGADNKQLWFHHAGVDGRQWHTFAMEWTPKTIKIFRDGTLAWTVSNTAVIPDVPHHLSIQLDAFKKSMTGTVRLQVDWVKIYKRVTVTTVDTTAPAARMAAPSLRTGPLNAGRPSVRLQWSATDAGSGVRHVELAQSTDGGANVPIATQSAPWRRNRIVAPGHSYRFGVRAVDVAGNVGAWSYGPTRKVAAASQSSASARYAGTWSSSTSTTWLGGTARSSSTAGSTARFTFTGKSVAWVGLKAANRGKANVYVNGVLKATVDLYSPTTLKQRIVWAANYATTATRTVTIKVLGTSGRPRVDIDGFIVAS